MKMPHWQWRPACAFLVGSVLISASLAVAQLPTPPPKHAIDTATNDLEQLMKIEIVDLSATVYNVFGTRYGDPVDANYVQDIIRQDGRSVRVKSTLHY
jgi:hypothetical protein